MLANPSLIRQEMLRRSPKAPLSLRMEYDALVRNDYAYGMHHAALQARALGIERITAIEFGVFGGIGLRNMEQISWCIKQEVGVAFDLYGFDTESGMPPPVDHRDMGFIWAPGLFAPPKPLREVLKRAKMVVGDIADTVSGFCAAHNPPPIGFMSIDVDYYSSTIATLKLLDESDRFFLPRVFVYLDDTIGDDHELHGDHTGELAAVHDFNAAHPMRKISRINGLRWKRRFPSAWNDQMFVAHLFDHPRYNEYINPKWTANTAQRPTKAPEVVVRPQTPQVPAGRVN